METAALRKLTSDTCSELGGELWPNGLGFDVRDGSRTIEVCFIETRGQFSALTRGELDDEQVQIYDDSAALALSLARTAGGQ